MTNIGKRAGPVAVAMGDHNLAQATMDLGIRPWAEELLREFACYCRVAGIYSATHGRVVVQEERLAALLAELDSVAPQGVTIELGESDVRVAGEITETRAGNRLARDLRPLGILSIQLDSGTTTEEVVKLAKCVSAPLQALKRAGGVRALIEAASLEHITVEIDRTVSGDHKPSADTGPADDEEQQASPEPGVGRSGWRASIDAHDASVSAVKALCSLLPAARSADEYRSRRSLLFRVAKRGEMDRRVLCNVLAELTAGSPALPFENSASMTLELAAETSDGRLIERVVSTRLSQEEARSVAIRLASHEESFGLLSFLAASELPGGIQGVFASHLVASARRAPNRFERWALANITDFLSRRVVGLFLEAGPYLIGPVAKQIMLEGGEEDRRKLIDQLVHKKTPTALRILALGLSYGGDSRDTYLIEALGYFPHPLATTLLREVVHRCNANRYRPGEVAAAVRALVRSPDLDAREFLHEVCQRRSLLLFSYRRPIRREAERGLLREVA